jgi:hypothetical protein
MSPLDLGGLYCGSTSTREREVMVAICAAGARILHLLSIFCAVVMGLSTLFIRALMPQRVCQGVPPGKSKLLLELAGVAFPHAKSCSVGVQCTTYLRCGLGDVVAV